MKPVIFAAIAAMFAFAPVVNAAEDKATTTTTETIQTQSTMPAMSMEDCKKAWMDCKDDQACKDALTAKGCTAMMQDQSQQ